MTTRIGPINNTHDKCDDEAREACKSDWEPMPIFPLYEENFVMLNNQGLLIEGDPRKAAGRRALETIFEKQLARNRKKYNGHIAKLYKYVLENGGPLKTNKLAERVISSDDNATIRLLLRARACTLPTALANSVHDPISNPSTLCNSCKNNNTSNVDTSTHALSECPLYIKNNDLCIEAITNILLNIQDPLATVWNYDCPSIESTQRILDERWPDTFQLYKQTIRIPKPKTTHMQMKPAST
jgi:hypothetical protein